MRQKLTALIRRLNSRYLIVGVSIYIFELLVIVVAQKLGESSVVAVGISFWAGLIISFILQKVITFGDKRTHHKVLVAQVFAFSLLVLFNFLFTIGITKLLTPTVPAVISRTMALAITTLWNFYLYKKHIFRKPQAQQGNN